MLHVDTRDPTPVPAQIERSLRAVLAEGLLRPGDPLPTVRQLAVSLRVNANILARAYRELEQAGLVELRSGLGAFVRGPDGGEAGAAGREALASLLPPPPWAPAPPRFAFRPMQCPLQALPPLHRSVDAPHHCRAAHRPLARRASAHRLRRRGHVIADSGAGGPSHHNE